MPKRNILIADDQKANEEFLTEYFSETRSIPLFVKSAEDLRHGLSIIKPEVVFAKVEWLNEELRSTFEAYRHQNDKVKFFSLGYAKSDVFHWDNQFEIPLEGKAFRKGLLGEMTYPDSVKLLVVDDEQGILEMFKDFFELQKHPTFIVETARNGLEGFQKVEKCCPDCIVLDLKMPVRNGMDFFSDLYKSGRDIATIVFIDATSPEEISKICRYGKPVFVEKSGQRSSMQEMLGIIKKLIVFS